MNILVLAEKPSVARDLAAVLGATKRHATHLEGNGYLVSWCIGHLVGLGHPQAHHPDWKSWQMDLLPMIPEPFVLEALPKTASHFKALKKLLTSPLKGVINACDAGREGELIFRYVYDLSGSRLPIKRLWIASLTKESIEAGFKELASGDDFEALYQAAQARSQADWLVGLNATRALTLATQERNPHTKAPVLSIGRVQTPTLGMLVKRHHEIEAFVPQDYWELEGDFAARYRGMLVDEQGHTVRFERKDAIEGVRAQLEPHLPQARLAKIEMSQSTRHPPELFDLTSLQRLAHTKLGFSAQQTLDVAQALYETHKLLSYPRTDSRHLTPDMAATLPRRLEAIGAFEPLEQLVQSHTLAPEGLGPRLINAKKVTDHHAILPTETSPRGLKLSSQEAALYELVARRLLAAMAPGALIAKTVLWSQVGPARFRTQGSQVLSLGWMRYEREEKEEEDKADSTSLPSDLTEGMSLVPTRLESLAKKTKAPSRLNESSLLGAMETAGKSLESELKSSMSGHGLGTPATRASIIETLISREYIARKGKDLIPTELGINLIGQLNDFEPLISAELTARWELGLQKIEEGQLDPKVFLDQVKQLTRALVAHFKQDKPTGLKLEAPAALGPCPLCKAPVYVHDKYVACAKSDKSQASPCGFRFSRQMAKKTLTQAQLKSLLTSWPNPIGPIKGFKSTAGKSFDAKVTFDQERSGLSFVFEERPPQTPPRPFGACPSCQKPTALDERTISCSGCGFKLWRTVAKKTLSESEIKLLLEQGKTDKLGGFVSSKGKSFEAALELVRESDRWKVNFIF